MNTVKWENWSISNDELFNEDTEIIGLTVKKRSNPHEKQ